MCFRPAGADSGGHQCPECGKTIQMMGGIVMKACPFCKADLTKYVDENGNPKAAAPGAPGAPAAPGAPGAPAAPGAPGAPKAPGA
ncbi:MAG: hypothetical protein HFJ65_05445 [Eggerthellaceae bacterium]|nr:hypothetical protein [Eggerthellaceae bacterium]